MNQNNNPSQHRPNRWARLKSQLKQARADRDTATRLKNLAQLYIVEVGLWDEFNDWLNDHTDTNNSTAILDYIERQARQIKSLNNALNNTRVIADIYSESKCFYYEMLGKKDEQINSLTTIVGNLTKECVEQREQIADLKKQRQHNGNTTRLTDEGNAPDTSTAPTD